MMKQDNAQIQNEEQVKKLIQELQAKEALKEHKFWDTQPVPRLST